MRHLSIIMMMTLCLGLLTGCRHKYDARLTHAESIMADYPDSAMSILESVDSATLRGGDLALYALLKTEAQEKLYMDPTNDSLIQIAVNYYSERKEYEHRAKAYYYQGRVRFYRDTLAGAIISFFKARETGTQHDLPFWAGQACTGISDVAMAHNNAPEALNYTRQQLNYMR